MFASLIDMATITPIFTDRIDHATLAISASSLFARDSIKKDHIINCYSIWGFAGAKRTVFH